MKIKKVIIGSDHAGFELKEKLKDYLLKKGIKIKDEGTYSSQSCDYPDFAFRVAKAVSEGKYKRGILICKTGIGNSIVANRFRGVRAALCYNLKTARLSRQHNDSNILVLGADFITLDLAKRILLIWLNTPFLAGRHRRRLNKIKQIEREIFYVG
ncbi:MAG: ribose 5-phosphate isomerase B [Candidatus Omnitrophica bacterium]|nr:ribose 5-phosphate isomerase B [Candidatus Omnitrophota bacterium]